MKVKGYEVFKCDAGWRTFSFLKLVTDDGIIGWSEYNESFGSPGLSAVIEALMPNVIGMDPHEIELVNAVLATRSTQSRGGIARQAIAAIENALSTSRARRWAFRSIDCSAASCATAFRSTGRIAGPTGCALPRSAACRRCGPTTT